MTQYRNIFVNYFNSSNPNIIKGLLSIDDTNIELVTYDSDAVSKVSIYSSYKRDIIRVNINDISLDEDNFIIYDKNGFKRVDCKFGNNLVKIYKFIDSQNVIHYILTPHNEISDIAPFSFIDIYSQLKKVVNITGLIITSENIYIGD